MANRLDFVNRFYSNRGLTPTPEPTQKVIVLNGKVINFASTNKILSL